MTSRSSRPRPQAAIPDASAGHASVQRRFTVALTSITYFTVTVDALVVVTALPAIHRDLGGNASTLQWTVSAYNIAFASWIIAAAAAGDRIGRRRAYLSGVALSPQLRLRARCHRTWRPSSRPGLCRAPALPS
jgi:hypothetical protein